MELCKKPPARPLAAHAAKEYFFRARVLLILLCKINKTRALKNFILPPQAAEYFLHNLRLLHNPIKLQMDVIFMDFAKQNP